MREREPDERHHSRHLEAGLGTEISVRVPSIRPAPESSLALVLVPKLHSVVKSALPTLPR
jgi:hypothetical protein